MLTPQEVSEHAFQKASFGGYNMAQVDEFLDVLTEDYSALYSENAVLKSKMKVLVDKVEEYRSTEEAMRKALMTAQRMADDLVKEAEQKKAEILREVESDALRRKDELSRELDVTLRTVDGAEARLVFPEYLELFEENVPNHNFNYTLCGAGYPYHQCFQNKKFSLLNYDLLWDRFLQVEHDDAAAMRLAWYRLRFPLELTDQCAAAYRQYLRSHTGEVLTWLLESRDAQGVAFLLRQAPPDREALAAACALARELGAAEALALLLEDQHKRFPAGRRRTFDL